MNFFNQKNNNKKNSHLYGSTIKLGLIILIFNMTNKSNTKLSSLG
jgi:hypothetical protein